MKATGWSIDPSEHLQSNQISLKDGGAHIVGKDIINIFTDGSKTKHGVRAAFCVLTNDIWAYQWSAKLNDNNTVFQAELTALHEAVDDCMEALGLKEHQNNKASQLSGGQRKRLCIAQEIVSNPPLIFLDEPTSGLDSSSCLQCVQLLKSLAEEGRTVICTIHQPSARIFELFDKLYMLAEGHCIYKGSTKNLIPFLSEQGLSCPTYHHPADFAMELAAGGNADGIWKLKTAMDTFHATSDGLSLTDKSFIFDGKSEVGLQASTLGLLKDQVENKPSLLKENALESSFGDYATSFWNQFKVLTYRSLICTFRDPVSTRFL
ncbi:ATP-binding cassette sub-family G member 1 [Araneus ventricosus]|uniref:ATP-binding cassette sub-family G member 1 n=1 Tax=Araneus ventricosus TaxID=182803 RepID=A0A4Y2FIZ8_ARAVE|nr:ATP-binding cassette sub-family G member 1 [Araneus ventricosus]